MIKLKNEKLDNGGVIVVSDKELETFSFKQLYDFDDNFFQSDEILDVDYFVEYYLEKRVNYYKLSADSSILGMTMLQDGVIHVYEGSLVKSIRAKKGDIFKYKFIGSR